MSVVIDISLKERIAKKKYDNSEVHLLWNCIDSLEKSVSGQLLRVVEFEGKIYKIMEKRATRAYRVYFIVILYLDYVIIVDIVKKKFQREYIDYLEKNVDNIFRRNFKV